MTPPVEPGFRPAEQRAGRQFVRALQALPGAMVFVRDRNGIMLDCNEAYAAFLGHPKAALMGQMAGVVVSVPKMVPFIFKHLHPVFERDMEASHWLLMDGRRHIARAWPLDPAEWGTTGYAGVLVPTTAEDGSGAGLITERTMGPLEALSPTELAVLYHFAKGHPRAEIARLMSRSEHTIHEHFKGIHAKMDISRQQDLAALIAELGIKAFTPEQWKLLTGAPV